MAFLAAIFSGITFITDDGVGNTAVSDQTEDTWTFANLWTGIKHVHIWLSLAARVFLFDRTTYKEIADDKRMTGPALLLGLFFAVTSGYFRAGIEPAYQSISIRIASWLIAVFAVFLAGRLLTRKGDYSRTLRALGFAQVVHVIEFVSLIPILAPLAIVLSTIMTFIATWMAASVAHDSHGWRTIVLPFVMIFVVVFIPIILFVMLGSIVFSFESVLRQLGLVQP